jgi:hypothetical protein
LATGLSHDRLGTAHYHQSIARPRYFSAVWHVGGFRLLKAKHGVVISASLRSSAYQAPVQPSSITLTPGTATMIMQRPQRWKSAHLRQWPALRRLGFAGGALAAVAFGFASWPAAMAQTAGGPAQPLITQPVNDANLFKLAGNTRPEAQNPANDRGRVDDAMPMPDLMLQLRRPAAQEQALATLIDQLHDPKSPNYHHWLTAGHRRAVRSCRVRHRNRHQLAHPARLHRQHRLSKRHGD